MDVKDFLSNCAGRWFSQRTSYQITAGEVENDKSDLTIDHLGADHPEVVKLCSEHGIDANLSLGGLKTSWDTSVDWGKPKRVGSTLLVLVGDGGDAGRGKLLKSSTAGQYSMGEDATITLEIEENGHRTAERIWFASENLRLRTSITEHADGSQQTVFYSEIRKVTAPPAP